VSNPRRYVAVVDTCLIVGALLALLWLTHEATRQKPSGRPPPDAGVSLGAVWRSEGGVLTALPARGEVLVYDRFGQHRATLLDGTWPLRLVVFPPRGEPLLLEVDELGRSSFHPVVPSEAP